MAVTPSRDSHWRKSSASNPDQCVEVAFIDDEVLVRDSKSPDDAMLRFTPSEWKAFVIGVNRGEFDLAS